MHIFALFLPFFRIILPLTYNKPYFGFINGINGLFGIQNMGIDTKIRTLAIIQAKILKNTKIMAAILENGVCRKSYPVSNQAPKIF